jgi:hypothetical protein
VVDPAGPGQSVLEEGATFPRKRRGGWACDASRVVIRHDGEGRLVEIRARTRTIPPALRRALLHPDKMPESPAAATVPVDPVAALRARHAAEGLRLHAGTGLAQWFGERLDVSWAIDVQHPRATRQGDAPTRAHRRDADES